MLSDLSIHYPVTALRVLHRSAGVEQVFFLGMYGALGRKHELSSLWHFR